MRNVTATQVLGDSLPDDQETKKTTPKSKELLYLKWLALTLIALFNGYATILMFYQHEIAFAVLTLILTSIGIYIFARERTYVHRYIFPGIAGMVIFVIFPLVYTLGIAFTNYSATNQLSLERVRSVLLDRTFSSGDNYKFTLYKSKLGHKIGIMDHGYLLISDDINLNKDQNKSFQLRMPVIGVGETPAIPPKLPLKQIIKLRDEIGTIDLIMPQGNSIRMNGLRTFSAILPLYTLQKDGSTLINNKTNQILVPNMEIGFYQPIDGSKNYIGEPISPGFSVGVGTKNFERILNDDGIKEPFFQIFLWTFTFSAISVAATLFIGMILASIVQWESLKGRALYRMLLILPYAVPAFISILIFRGLFNQSFGEINILLENLFNIKPDWFTDPMTAKLMVLIVNIWLGFPYMMILCMGLLKAIPSDLYEASAIDGATYFNNFFNITLPLMMKPLTPLLIASFAFNFNNFVMIQLLTQGGPNMIGTSEAAGYTDLLVSYTYRIAFEGSGGQDFGLASAITTLIFILVGALALLNMHFTKVAES